MPLEINKEKLLIGEGADEKQFLETLLEYLGIEDVQVIDAKGKSKICPMIQQLMMSSGFAEVSVLCVCLDADENPDAAFDIVKHCLSREGLPTPARPGEIAEGTPKTGAFVTPDGNQTGMLEDLCWQAVKERSPSPCVEEFMMCLDESTWDIGNPSKARLYAWLATQNRPEVRLGHAAEYGYFPWDHEAFERLRNFLRAI